MMIRNLIAALLIPLTTFLSGTGLRAEIVEFSYAWDGANIAQFDASGNQTGTVGTVGGIRGLDYGTDGTLYFSRSAVDVGLYLWNGLETQISSHGIFGNPTASHLAVSPTTGEFSFAWDGANIGQWDSAGNFLGTITSSSGIRSLEYGADGTLFFTRSSGSIGLFSWDGTSETLVSSHGVFSNPIYSSMAISPTSGEFSFAWNGANIAQWDSAGNSLGTITSSGGVRGLDYATDGTLYFSRSSGSIGLFSWDGTSETQTSSSGIFANPTISHLSVFSMQAIPEPTTLITFSMVAISIGFSRRRRIRANR